ncbi:MAG: hypothetical protein Q6373_023285 [Candidatus Sigynarchaeota archaeon]
MFVVEIGILHREKSLVRVGFYRRDETLSDITRDQIIAGIYSIVPEIFRDHVLKRLNVEKYTILFNGFEIKPEVLNNLAGNNPRADIASKASSNDPGRIALVYAIIDSMSDNLDETIIKAVQAKIKQIGDMFMATIEKEGYIETVNIEPFKQKIIDVFKDMLKRPADRFDDMWLGNLKKSKKQ